MKLTEFEGKELFRKYGILTPKGVLVTTPKLPRAVEIGSTRRGRDGKSKSNLHFPAGVAVKAQVLSGERYKGGGVVFAGTINETKAGIKRLLGSKIAGEKVEKVLIEEKIDHIKEYYFGFSYDTESRGPVLALSPRGGSQIGQTNKSTIVPFDITLGAEPFIIREALSHAKFPSEDFNALVKIIQRLWKLFIDEYALIAEINPLFKAKDGEFIAGDAKVILDDEKLNPGERRFIELGGDIAILASGGGASLLNIDALLHYGGKPANYTEYSGNPPAELVKELTKRVLNRKGLKGCWVIGGTANFTDIYETMRGFIEGLKEIKPKVKYPIVIRRDGPRQEEALLMLREIAEKKGYNFHLFGSEVSMAESARFMVNAAYRQQKHKISSNSHGRESLRRKVRHKK